jgi:hypothetical protein
MATLTNFADHCDLLNLGFGPGGKGPYVLRQSGSPPGSMTLQQDSYLLRKDGTWVLNLTVFSLPEKDVNENFLFRDFPELFSVIGDLGSKPLVIEDKLPTDKSRAEILAALQTTASNLLSRIRDAKGAKLER